MQNAYDLFLYDLSIVRSVEVSKLQMLSRWEQASQSERVKRHFSREISDTQRQITRLDDCFRILGAQPLNVTSHAVACMSQDFDQCAGFSPSQELLETFCLGEALKLDHYEIACYMNLVDEARALGRAPVISPLEDNLRDQQVSARDIADLSHQLISDAAARMTP